MSTAFSTASYKDVFNELSAALAWLSSLNVRVSNTRISTYEAAIRILAEHDEAGTLDKLYPGTDIPSGAPQFPEVASAFFGATELIAVHRGLGHIQDPVLIEKLRIAVKGPLTYSAETLDSNLPRNTLFELAIAARLATLGLQPKFVPPSDIFIPVRARRVLAECKRPQDLANLEKNARRAFRQLETRYAETGDARTRGIIALDVSKAINPHFAILSFKDDQQIAHAMSRLIDNLVRNHPNLFQAARHKNTFGVILKFSAMAVNQDQNRLTQCQQYGLVEIPSRRESDRQLLLDLANRFS